MSDTGPSVITLSDAERLKRLERIVAAAREGKSEDREIVEILGVLAPYLKNGNEKIMKVVVAVLSSLVTAGIIGGVVMYGDVRALQAEIQQCQKVKS